MGRLLGPFGVAGWLKVKVFTERRDALGNFPRWLVHAPEGWTERTVEDFEVHAKGPVVKLDGCDDRDAAYALQGCDVAVPRGALEEPEEGSLYWVDLIGLDVVDEAGLALGKVEGLFETGETSVLVVKGSCERMIPFIPDYVKSVDREGRVITVDWQADYDA